MKFETKIFEVMTHHLNKNLYSEKSDQAPLNSHSETSKVLENWWQVGSSTKKSYDKNFGKYQC